MMLQELTPVSNGALPLVALRAHLRLGTGFNEDSLQDPVLESFLRAALAAVEARVSKALIAREFSLQVHEWTRCEAVTLPLAPVSSITSVVLRDGNDVAQTLAPTMWRLRPDSMMPEVVSRGAALPRIASGGSATITFVAGYGTWSEVPPDLQQAVFLLTAHYYENRQETHLGSGCMPFGVTALLERYRVMRVGFGGQS